MAHVAKTAVRGVDSAGDNPEFPVRDFLAEQIVLSVEGALMEPAELVEPGFCKQHEHAGTERPAQQGTVLHQVAAEVEQFVTEIAAIAPDVGGHAVQITPLSQFDGPTEQSAVFQFHVSVNEKNKRRGGLAGAGIAAYGRQSSRDDLHVEPPAEAERQFLCAVCGTGISNEYFGMPHLRVVLPGQGLQQVRQ